MSKDAQYTKKHDLKRKKKSYQFAFYLDDDEEQELYEYLQDQPNKRQFLLDLIKKHKNN